MATVLHVALWSVDTCKQDPGSWIRKTFSEKLSALNQALAAFFRFRLTHGNVATAHEPDRVRAIFVAPEYFLTQLRVDDEGYFARDYIGEGMHRDLMKMMPGPINTLLVPGTMARRKLRTQERVEKYTTGVPELNVTNKTHFIRNTAYGFIHARKVLTCSKQGAATDGFSASDPDVFVPGWSTNKALLTVPDGSGTRQLRFGIEICADASSVRSGPKGYVDTTDDAAVDVKILVSAALASAHVYHGNYTRALIHACSDPQYSGVVVKGANTTAHMHRQNFMGHQLDFCSLTLA